MRATILAAVLLLPAPALGQTVQGRTLDAANGAWVPAVVLTLRSLEGDSVAAAVSDSEATFRIRAPRAGRYVLHAARIGFSTLVTQEFDIRAGEYVNVEVLLGADPVELDPLTVTSRRYDDAGFVGQHRRRADWIQRTGIGRVVTRADIDASPRPYVSDYLYGIPGIQVVGSGGEARVRMRGCVPTIFVDGVRSPGLQINALNPESLEGIEVYRSLSEAPVELRGAGPGCGAISMWTRAGERTPGKWTLLQKVFAAAGGTALGILLLSQF